MKAIPPDPRPRNQRRRVTVTQQELDELLARAKYGSAESDAFFRALLDAMVYAHEAIRKSDRVGFVMINAPGTNQPVLPFFTDRTKAIVPLNPTRRIIALLGRQFPHHTLGARLVLNPNDQCVFLYPEEIKKLLETSVRRDEQRQHNES